MGEQRNNRRKKDENEPIAFSFLRPHLRLFAAKFRRDLDNSLRVTFSPAPQRTARLDR